MIEVQGHKIMLKAGQWSRWTKLNFEFVMPWFVPNKNVSGICRFYLQEVRTQLQALRDADQHRPVRPRGANVRAGVVCSRHVQELGLFYTTGFQEAYSARKDGVFRDDEYLEQAEHGS